MLSLAIAARFLRSSLGQTTLIVAGIGVGIAVVVFVGSLITSLQNDLIDTTVGSRPHVTIQASDGGSVPGSLADEAMDDPAVTAAIPVRTLSVIYTQGEASSALSVTGGLAEDLDSVYDLSGSIVQGSFSLASNQILVGTDFAENAELAAGDTVPFILPNGQQTEYELAGILDLGSTAANERLAFSDGESAQVALGMAPDDFSEIQIQVDDIFTSNQVAGDLAADGLTVVDWQDENEELLSGLAAQSGSSFMIQAFVLIAVALGIASTLAISAVQKTKQIGILKAMGMRDGAAGRIFLFQAAILGVAGVLVGIGFGYLLIWGFSFAPVEFSVAPSPALIGVSAVIGILVALLSAVIPVRSTSRLEPIEVIQNG